MNKQLAAEQVTAVPSLNQCPVVKVEMQCSDEEGDVTIRNKSGHISR